MREGNRRATGTHRLRGAAFALIIALAAPAGAAPIVTWDLASATGQQADVLSTAAGLSASVIDEVGVDDWNSNGQEGFIAASGWATSATTYDPGRYYQWSITADAGLEVTYETLDISLFRGIQGPNHGAEKWDLRASTDAFASVDVDLGTFDISSSGADVQTTFLGHDLSALGTQTGTVTFRLYGYDYTSASDFSGLGNDDGAWLIHGSGVNPTVGGSVAAAGSAVAEPAPFALAVAGLLGLLALGNARPRPPQVG